MFCDTKHIDVKGAFEHNLKGVDLKVERESITVITGVSGSGKSSIAFDTILIEAQRRFFYTLSHYSRQFLDMGTRPRVRFISGLSPAIALAQNETVPSIRATVGTLTDINELFGVMFASFGEQYCPKHGQPVSAQSVESLVDKIYESEKGNNIAICAPIVESKKGNYKSKLEHYFSRGFVRAYIDGDIYNLDNLPTLEREVKHTIKLIIDVVKINETSKNRLVRSVNTAVDEADGVIECFHISKSHSLDMSTQRRFSTKTGCPVCGYSWPKLDSRYFSANSLGRCSTCNGLGVSLKGTTITEETNTDDDMVAQYLELEDKVCVKCDGTGLNPDLRNIKINGASLIDIQKFDLSEINNYLDKMKTTSLKKNPVFLRLYDEIKEHVGKIIELGVGYLNLSRRIRSLSGGELQRLKLAMVLGEYLRGILYILDEPSQGLHPSEIAHLCKALKHLKDQGNTILIVDHDEALMREADYIIDLGPGGGRQGGNVIAKFNPSQASKYASISATAAYLANPNQVHSLINGTANSSSQEPEEDEHITIYNPKANNLHIDSVSFLKGRVNVVTGVSGAGKSSLVISVLYKSLLQYTEKKRKKSKFTTCDSIEGLEEISRIELIDRKSIAKSVVSIPATYLNVFTEIREIYGKLPESQIAGLTAASFSLAREGGRCEECKGRGEVTLKMKFLADASMKCPVCNGKRYRPHILSLKYNGLSISEVLDLTIEEVYEHFKTFKHITKRLKPAIDLGLGYLKLGQPSISLSGGEAQRLKIVPYLSKTFGSDSILILNEPTSGLHFADVKKMLISLRDLVRIGVTVIIIEHHKDVILSSDWVVDLGPGSSKNGGRLVFQGVPGDLLKYDASITANCLV